MYVGKRISAEMTLSPSRFRSTIINSDFIFQRVLSNLTPYWCRKIACSTTYTTKAIAGPSNGGMLRLPWLAPIEVFSSDRSPCCCLVGYPSLPGLSSCAVQNISKVSTYFVTLIAWINLRYNVHLQCWDIGYIFN